MIISVIDYSLMGPSIISNQVSESPCLTHAAITECLSSLSLLLLLFSIEFAEYH